MIANPIYSNKSGSGNSFTVPTPFEVSCWEKDNEIFDDLIAELASEDPVGRTWYRIDPENFMIAIIIECDGDLEEIRYATMEVEFGRTTLIGPVQLYGQDATSLVEFIFFKDGTVSAHVLIRDTGDTVRIMRPRFYIKGGLIK